MDSATSFRVLGLSVSMVGHASLEIRFSSNFQQHDHPDFQFPWVLDTLYESVAQVFSTQSSVVRLPCLIQTQHNIDRETENEICVVETDEFI